MLGFIVMLCQASTALFIPAVRGILSLSSASECMLNGFRSVTWPCIHFFPQSWFFAVFSLHWAPSMSSKLGYRAIGSESSCCFCQSLINKTGTSSLAPYMPRYTTCFMMRCMLGSEHLPSHTLPSHHSVQVSGLILIGCVQTLNAESWSKHFFGPLTGRQNANV